MGPGVANDFFSAASSSPAVVTLTPGTPIPDASATQSKGGELRSVRARVTGPGAGRRCLAHSICT
jgi:hypothetical protein